MEQNIIGTTIAALRREKGLTQDALAAQLGVSAQAVSKWENGLSCPDILMLPEIAELFGVSVDALFGRASVSAEPSAAPVPAEPAVVYHDLPWSEDETTLHAVLFELNAGDTVTFTDVDGNVFTYAVQETTSVTPDDSETVMNSGYALTMYTCTWDTSARITVFCERTGGELPETD